jgi:phosphatidate cytidylyltransferase
MAEHVDHPQRSNLATRLLTAGVVVPLMLLLLYVGPVWGWSALVLAATALSAAEFFHLSHPNDGVSRTAGILLTVAFSAGVYWGEDDPRVLVTLLALLPLVSLTLALARPGDIPMAGARIAATSFGPLWVGMLTFIALLRRDQGANGPGFALMTLMFAWFADTGGYFAGRFLGRHPLYPAISPKKTVEGLGGAVLGAMIGALLAHFWYLPVIPLADALVLSVVCGLCGQLGDLGESLLKRGAGVKDSGEIVPGHGGMLDRLDALFVTSALVYLYSRWH